MMKNWIYALYLVRIKAKDVHEEAFSSAIFYVSLLSMLLFSSIFILLAVYFNITLSDDVLDAKVFGVKVIYIVASGVYFTIWVVLKIQYKLPIKSDLKTYIQKNNYIEIHKNTSVVVPVILTMVISFIAFLISIGMM